MQTIQPQNVLGKLPDLGLPSFYGNYETWLGFYDIFNAVIHNRTDLTEIQKFLYLKVCCKGDALKIIDNLEVTSSNYSIAIDLLKNRYENKRAIIINHHINCLLFKLPQIESAHSIRTLIDTVTQHHCALEKLKLPVQHWDSLLIPIILNKLDDRSRCEWENKLDNNNYLPTLKELIDFLSRKCFTLDAVYDEKKSYLHSKSNNNCSNNNYSKIKQENVQQCYKVFRFY